MANLYISIRDGENRLIVDGNLRLFRDLLTAIDRDDRQPVVDPKPVATADLRPLGEAQREVIN